MTIGRPKVTSLVSVGRPSTGWISISHIASSIGSSFSIHYHRRHTWEQYLLPSSCLKQNQLSSLRHHGGKTCPETFTERQSNDHCHRKCLHTQAQGGQDRWVQGGEETLALVVGGSNQQRALEPKEVKQVLYLPETEEIVSYEYCITLVVSN